jgi:hypothetical protein
MAAAVASESDIAMPAASQIIAEDFAQSQIQERFHFLTIEKHFSHNLNAAWQKLDDYYTRTDATPIYRTAIFLHPTLKWRWFERYWATKPEWIAAARVAIEELWSEYKHTPADGNTDANTTAMLIDRPATRITCTWCRLRTFYYLGSERAKYPQQNTLKTPTKTTASPTKTTATPPEGQQRAPRTTSIPNLSTYQTYTTHKTNKSHQAAILSTYQKK